MSFINRYLNYLTEFDNEAVKKMIEDDFGFFRLIVPIYWDFGRKSRWKTLAYLSFVECILLMATVSSIGVVSHYDILPLATKGAVQMSFMGVAMSCNVAFVMYRRNTTFIYGLMCGGFGRYDDFDGQAEEDFERDFRTFRTKLRRAWCVLFACPLLVYLFCNGIETWLFEPEENSRLRYINPYAPMLLWLPFDDTQASVVFYPTVLMSAVVSIITGMILMALTYSFILIGLRIVTQIERLKYAMAHLENRSFRRWKRINSSSETPVNRLYLNPTYISIYKECLRHTVEHHLLILK